MPISPPLLPCDYPTAVRQAVSNPYQYTSRDMYTRLPQYLDDGHDRGLRHAPTAATSPVSRTVPQRQEAGGTRGALRSYRKHRSLCTLVSTTAECVLRRSRPLTRSNCGILPCVSYPPAAAGGWWHKRCPT